MRVGIDGDKLDAALRRKGWTQAELARQLGVAANSISNWKLGKTNCSAITMRRMAALLCVSPDYLAGTAGPAVAVAEAEGALTWRECGGPADGSNGDTDTEGDKVMEGRDVYRHHGGLQNTGDTGFPTGSEAIAAEHAALWAELRRLKLDLGEVMIELRRLQRRERGGGGGC